jgi:hypothetical protein
MAFLTTDREEEAAGVGDAMTLPLSDWSGSRCSVMAAVAIERDLYRGGVETGKTIHKASSTISRRMVECVPASCRVSVENHDAIVGGRVCPPTSWLHLHFDEISRVKSQSRRVFARARA